MIRSWGVVTLAGVAVPWFGDVTTAAIALPQGNGVIPVTVASTKRYKAGDRIIVDPGATDQDCLLVDTIPSATVLNCRSEGNATTHTHVTATLIELSIACMDVIIQNLSAAVAWLGTDNTVTAIGGGSAFYELAIPPAAPNVFREADSVAGVNTCRTNDGWIIGTGSVAVSAVVL
jgi:hypothetical protein